MKKFFCTYFDYNFLYQGLALYESLAQQVEEFEFWILCLDDKTFNTIGELKFHNINLISLKDIESTFPQLLTIKSSRSKVEYYWTITPFLLQYILKLNSSIKALAYLDADLFFFSSINPIFNEWKDGSIYLVPHRFRSQTAEIGEKEAGKYNVGFVGIKNDPVGNAALKLWGSQTIEWCYDRIEEGKMGDQGYLNDWAERFSNVIVSSNIGVGVGGWNIMNYNIRKPLDHFVINEQKLIFVHFNFIKFVSNNYIIGIPRRKLKPLYVNYATTIIKVKKMVNTVDQSFTFKHANIPLHYILYSWIRGGLVRC